MELSQFSLTRAQACALDYFLRSAWKQLPKGPFPSDKKRQIAGWDELEARIRHMRLEEPSYSECAAYLLNTMKISDDGGHLRFSIPMAERHLLSEILDRLSVRYFRAVAQVESPDLWVALGITAEEAAALLQMYWEFRETESQTGYLRTPINEGDLLDYVEQLVALEH